MEEGKLSVLQEKQRKELLTKWITVIGFLGFSVLDVWVLFYKNPDFNQPRNWLIIVGAILFPFMTVQALRDLKHDWSEEEQNRQVLGPIFWTLRIALVIVCVGLLALAAIWLFGWFGSIPSWAAVIIVLLSLILVFCSLVASRLKKQL
jgi:hypothetical protein